MRVKILKNGFDREHSYHVGEIYEGRFTPGHSNCITLLPSGAYVTYKGDSKYGIECKIIPDEIIYELW